jgi:hypothetical protein
VVLQSEGASRVDGVSEETLATAENPAMPDNRATIDMPTDCPKSSWDDGCHVKLDC